MEGSQETAGKPATITDTVRERIWSVLEHDPVSQKIKAQFEKIARSRMKLPDQAKAIGKTAAIAANATDIMLAVAFGGWGISDFLYNKRGISDVRSAKSIQQKIIWGAAKLAAAPILLGLRPIARGTVLIGSSH